MSKKTDDSKHDLPRYSGIPTLLRAPFSESFDDLDIALVGVPYDGGVTFRPGARHGPMEMRQQSALMRRYHGVTRQAPFEQVKTADIGDVPMEHHYSIEDTFDDITRFYDKLYDAGVIPLSAGGRLQASILRCVQESYRNGHASRNVHRDQHAVDRTFKS